MAKKKNPGGADDRKRRDMATLVTPFRRDLLPRLKLAAAAAGLPVTKFVAAAAEAAMEQQLAGLKKTL